MLMNVSVLHIPLQLQTYRREEEKDRWFVKLVQPLSACTEKNTRISNTRIYMEAFRRVVKSLVATQSIMPVCWLQRKKVAKSMTL